MEASGGIEVVAGGMASGRQIELVIAEGANALACAGYGGALPNRIDNVGNGTDLARATVDLQQAGSVCQHMDVCIVEAGNQRHALAVNALSASGRHIAQPLPGADGGNAVATNGYVPADRRLRVHRKDFRVL